LGNDLGNNFGNDFGESFDMADGTGDLMDPQGPTPAMRRLYTARPHGVIYGPGILACLLAALAFWIGRDSTSALIRLSLFGFFIVAGFYGAIALLRAWARRWISRIEVFEHHVLIHRGLLRRHCVAISRGDITGIDIDQSLAGRILNYGKVTIRGTGLGIAPLPLIGAPYELRDHIAADNHKTARGT